MQRPMTLFTGQWADLPLDEVAAMAAEWGYDGLELACWGDHFEVPRALEDPNYCAAKRAQLERFGLGCWAISNHLVGQAVCDDPIDDRHRNILPPEVWGDGDPEGVRQRSAERMKDTARAAKAFGVDLVIGFTGSKIWKYVAMFPPVEDAWIEDGYADFADRWGPIIDVFEECGVKFALEPHPSEIAYDYWTTQRTLEAIGERPGFGINFDPSHFVWQGLDTTGFLRDFADRIMHVDCKGSVVHLDGRNGVLGSHLPWGDSRRGWDFVSAGQDQVPWGRIFRVLNEIGYDGPISVEWEDAGLERTVGAPNALEYLRSQIFPAPTGRFDSAFGSGDDS